MTLTLKLYDRHARKLQRDTGIADGTTETLALIKIVFDSVEGHPKATLQITPLTGEAPA